MKKTFSFLFGLIIFVELPMFCWGFNDYEGYTSNAARLIYLLIMIFLTIWVAFFVPDGGRSAGKGKKNMEAHKFSVIFLQIVSLAIVAIAPYSDGHGYLIFPDLAVLRFVGNLFVLIGFVTMNLAVIALGRQFSIDVTIQENHKLITTGPYSLVRHPRYTGIIVFFLGVALTFTSWIALILVVATFAALIWRIRDEEKLMYEEFGKDWESYKTKTYFLIPFIY